MTETPEEPLKRVLAELVGLGDDERTRRLSELEREDPALHEALTRRLGEESSGRTLFAGPEVSSGVPAGETMADVRIGPGTTVGSCLLVRLLGEGGMGAVYEARQEGLDRPVAIKFMKAGIVSRAARARFLHEARLLSRLQHPGIAQVHEVGLHELGGDISLPYYVLELVPEARTLTRHASDEKLDDRALVELFIRVAEAVLHGHRLGVIHRDLKPANILVDRDGRPKVIDFGLARVDNDELVTRSFETETGAVVGTLPYMSPEQLGGGEVDTRSDVYALGVVLYELLTGRRPHEFRGVSLPQAIAEVREVAAPRPRRFRPDIPADLETICLKSLRKDRAERYASLDALIEDLRRWREGLPILARPQSAAYALRLFARRNKALVFVMAAFLLLLVGATLVSVKLARDARAAAVRERERREQTERLLAASTALANWLVLDHLDRLARLPGGTRAAEETTGRILAWLGSMAADAGDDPELERSLALATFEVGAVLGSPSRPNLGRSEEALREVAKAERVFADRHDARPDDLERLVDLVVCRMTRAELEQVLGRFTEARAALESAQELVRRGRERFPDDGRLPHAEAEILRDLGQFAEAEGRLEEGLALVRRAVALREELRVRGIVADEVDEERSYLVDRMAELRLLSGLGREPEAAALAEELLPDLRAHGADDVIAGNDLAYVLTQLADALLPDDSRRERALALYAEARELRGRLLEHDPDDSSRSRSLALAEERLGFALAMASRPAEALAEFRRAETRLRELLRLAPASREARLQLRILLGHLVSVTGMLGEKEAMLAAAEEALALARELAAADPGDFGGRRGLGEALMGLGGALIQSSAPDDPPEVQRDVITRARRAFQESREVFQAMTELAERPVWLDAMLSACAQYVAVCDQALADFPPR